MSCSNKVSGISFSVSQSIRELMQEHDVKEALLCMWILVCECVFVCVWLGGGTTCDYNCRILACGRCTLVKYTQSQWEYWQAWVHRTQSQTLRCMYYTTTQTHCITLDALFQQMLSHVLWRYILTDYPTTIHTILSLCMCVSFCMSARCYTWFFTFFFFYTPHLSTCVCHNCKTVYML